MTVEDDIKRNLIKKILRLPKWKRNIVIILVSLTFLFIFLLLGKFGIYGEGVERFLEKKTYSKEIDCNKDRFVNNIVLFSVNGKSGMNGQTCLSGDTVDLEIETSQNVFMMLICVDSKGIHPIIPEILDPIFNDTHERLSKQIILDSVTGIEIYYFINSDCKFSYEKDIEPLLRDIQQNTKGQIQSEFYLYNTPFFCDLIYFKHK